MKQRDFGANEEKIVFDLHLERIQKNLFGLLGEYEKDGEWESFLDSIIMKLLAVEEKIYSTKYLELMFSLMQAKYYRHKYFRKIIFDGINLMGKIRHELLH